MIGENGQLFGWPEPVWLWLDQFGILLGNFMMLMTLGGAVWAWVRREELHRWFRSNRFPMVGEEGDHGGRWKGIVFTTSRAEVPVWVMERQRPAAVAFLASERSLEEARRLAERAKTLDVRNVHTAILADPDDPAEAKAATGRLIGALRKAGIERIAVDVTGGKTPMSLGAFMAAEENGCDSIYVSTEFDPKLKKPKLSTARIRCISCTVE